MLSAEANVSPPKREESSQKIEMAPEVMRPYFIIANLSARMEA